jgi:hypothetical protein
VDTDARPSNSKFDHGLSWPCVGIVLCVLFGCESRAPGAPSPEALERAQKEQLAARREAELRYEMAIRTQLPYLQRLWKVGFPLLQAGAGLCVERTTPRAGFEYWNRYAFGDMGVQYLERTYDLDDALVVLAVFPGGAAARAGLKEGDELLALDGAEVPTGPDSDPAFKKLLRENLKASQAIALEVRRGDERRTLSLVPQPVCDFQLDFSTSHQLGASSDGAEMTITLGMMNFAHTDEGLALVVSRELAHNILNHIDQRNGYAFMGGMLDLLAATQGIITQGAISQFASGINAKAFEAEADYVGLYLMARAGFEVEEAPQFWDTLVERDPSGSEYSALAYETDMPHRKAAMRNTIQEIEEKRSRGAPLMPDLASVLEEDSRDVTLTNR